MNKFHLAAALTLGLLLLVSSFAVLQSSTMSQALDQDALVESLGKDLESRFFLRHSDELKWLALQSPIREYLAGGGRGASPDSILSQASGLLSLDTVYLIDIHGKIVAASDPRFLGTDVSFRPYFREAMASRPAYDMAVGMVTKSRGVYAAVPVYSGNSVVGVAAFRTPATQLDGFLSRDSNLSLIDSTGVVYAASNQTLIGTIDQTPPGQTRRVVDGIDYRIGRYSLTSIKGATLVSLKAESWPWGLWIAVELAILLLGAFVFLAFRQFRASRSRKNDDRDRHQREILLANLLEGIAILDRGGAVVWANPAFTRLAQIDAAGTPPLMADLWDRPEPAPWRDVMEGRREWVVFESILAGRNGAWTPVLAGFTAAEDQYLLSVLDWSERYQSDQLLRQTQKLTVLGQLSGGIAHDLNNMLGVLMGMADLIKMSLAAEDPLHESADLMQVTLARAAALAEKMLDFARQTPIQRHPFDVSGLLRELRFLAKSALPPTTEAVVEVPQGVVLINGDENLLLSALLNLVLNGAEAQPEGGKVRVEGQRIAPGLFAIVVEDQGVGMDKETQARIFEPFFSTKYDKKGTGLGLSLVRRTILEHRGSIDVQSRLGEGTRITVTLPTDEPIALPARG